MKYIIVFAMVGAACFWVAATQGGMFWALSWPGLAFGLVAVGYAGAGPVIFGKRGKGTLSPFNKALLLPFLLLIYAVWYLQGLISKEPLCHRVAEGVWLGRRPAASDVPDEKCIIVDLTSEFSRHPTLKPFVYRGLPTLDAMPPASEAFARLVDEIGDAERLYVHCASGHGRSSTLVAAILLRRRLAIDPEDAERRLREIRPGVRLSLQQRRFLSAWWREQQA